jgi:short-subunit dehydrogenase
MFANRVAWITGASSGIGQSLATALLQRGAWVVLSGRRADALARVAAAAPERALVLPFEATAFDALPSVVEQAFGWRGHVDLLVNNAGISQRSLALDTSLDVYRQLIEVDYLAPVALTQQVLPRMVARRSGHIVVISSVAGKVGAPLRTGYCGAKHAVVGYFDALRAEVERAYGIRVSVVLPGSVRTAIAVNALTADGSRRGHSDEPIDSGMDPDEAARIIVDGLAAGQREIAVARGPEASALQWRCSAPDRLRDMLAEEGERLAAARQIDGPALGRTRLSIPFEETR